MQSLSCEELDVKKHQLIDIREEYERMAFKDDSSIHIPMGELISKAPLLDGEIQFVVHCETGVRSKNIVTLLNAKGFQNFWSLDGGAEALKKR